MRGIEVLHELALREGSEAISAEEALAELATNRATSVGQRAGVVLKSLQRARTAQGLRILQRLGASVTFSGVTLQEKNLGSGIAFVQFTNRWRGSIDDLSFLDWLADYRGIHVTLRGNQFDDRWLDRLTATKRLVSLQLNRATITDRGLSSVGDMSNLRVLSILYCDLSDECLKHVVPLRKSLESFSVQGSRITKQAFDEIANHDTGWRYGRGGFLGIGGGDYKDEEYQGCLVQSVQPNQAANIAGIREFDVIIAYNGVFVTQFAPNAPVPDDDEEVEGDDQDKEEEGEEPKRYTLLELIGQNEPGDKVTVTIIRGSGEKRRQLEKEVVLGEWP